MASALRVRLLLILVALVAGLAVVTFVSTGNLAFFLGVALVTGAVTGLLDLATRRRAS